MERHGPHTYSYGMQVIGEPKKSAEGMSAKVKFTSLGSQTSEITLDEGSKSHKIGDVTTYNFKQERRQ